jgi:hypothetical protein
MMEETDTAKTGEKAESSPAAEDAKSDSSTEKALPWDKDPRWKSARTAEKRVNDLLKANNLEDLDDLEEAVSKGAKLKGKKIDLDRIESDIEKARRLEEYEEYWKYEAENKRRTNETAEETLARMEKELRRREQAEKQQNNAKQQAEEAKRAIKSFENEVSDIIGELDTISKDERPFILEFLGVGNPSNEIDITDKRAVKKMIADQIKKKESYDQAIIKRYLDGKKQTPKVSTATGVSTESKPVTNFKGMRAALHDAMQARER